MREIKKLLSISVCFLMLAACGGGDPIEEVSDATDDTDAEEGSSVELGNTTNFSYLPLMTVEKYKEWSGGEEDDVFLTYGRSPSIRMYTINPINATTGLPAQNAAATDFNILEDAIPVNPRVSFPMLQPIVGNEIDLRTAILINTSSAMDVVDRVAFIDEIKAFVTASKASTVNHIKNQEFTVWGYSGEISEVTSGATSVEADILSAIDTLSANWLNGVYESTGANHTYDAIMRAIGRYVGPTEYVAAADIELRDSITLENNDLIEFVTPDTIIASSIILFSAGFGSSNLFAEEFAKKALESQHTLAYDLSTNSAGQSAETEIIGKPLIYVVPDGEEQDSIIVDKASRVVTTNISGAGGTYTFADAVVTAQKDALEEKFVLSNQHVLRWASAIRAGEKHSLEVSSRTAENQLSYTLAVEFDVAAHTFSMPDPQVEITGVNNEYIASNNLLATYDVATTYASLITTFYPATRWTNQDFASSDYTWTYSPANSMVENANGSVTIASGATFPITLTLTNNNITHDGNTVSDDFVLTIEAGI